MTWKFRALAAALIVIVAAAGGALFIAYRTNAAVHAGTLDVATTGDVNDLFGSPSASPPDLLALALRKLETTYYKPVDPQTALDGERTALRAYLNAKHVKDVALPDTPASSDPAEESKQLADELAAAASHDGTAGKSDSADLTETALRGIMGSVKDPYTVYLSPREIQGLNESLEGGNFGGIGVYIYQLKDGRVVVQPIEAMPAAKAGMKPGEVVDTVGGKSVKGLTLDRVEQMIRGEAGSSVQLTTHPYNKPSKERSYDIVREIIHVPTVRAKMEGSIDYIRLSDFGETSADEVHKALIDGQRHGAKGYILDLRDNGGGFLAAAVQISSFFVPQGTIVSTIDRAGNKQVEEATGAAMPGLAPLVILVNKYTASASEITSGALQDYHLATLIGTKTFGKGVVQSIYPMPDHGALKITTARYVTPLGRDIQHKGILPDIVVEQDPDPALIDTPADKQLAAAKARLSSLNR